MRIITAIGAMGVLALAGCETPPAMTAAECASADWRVLGFTDGAEGQAGERLAERTQICANAGYTLDQAAYDDGYQNGLRRFCQPERGFDLGERGETLGVSCPEDLSARFAAAYRDGREIYTARSAFESAESQVQSLESERENRIDKIQHFERAMQQATNQADFEGARNRANELRNELADINRRLREADRDLRYKRADFEDARWRLGRRNW